MKENLTTLWGDDGRARGGATQVRIGVVPIKRHVDAKGGDREGVTDPVPGVRIDDAEGLSVQVRDVADGSLHQPTCWLRKRAARVVLVDGHVDPGVGRDLPGRGVHPLALKEKGHVTHPRRVYPVTVGAHRLHGDVDGPTRARGVRDGLGLGSKGHTCKSQTAGHGDQQGERDN